MIPTVLIVGLLAVNSVSSYQSTTSIGTSSVKSVSKVIIEGEGTVEGNTVSVSANSGNQTDQTSEDQSTEEVEPTGEEAVKVISKIPTPRLTPSLTPGVRINPKEEGGNLITRLIDRLVSFLKRLTEF